MSEIFNWRAHLHIHPAAEIFPLMSEAELGELADDIKANGLRAGIVLWEHPNPDSDYIALLDGRNRLDALAKADLLAVNDDGALSVKFFDGTAWELRPLRLVYREGDPYRLAASYNIHRRHLTAEQKRDLIGKALKTFPEKSNRQIADQAMVSHPTVAKVRRELERTGDVETVSTVVDTKGREQPARKPHADADAAPNLIAQAQRHLDKIVDLLRRMDQRQRLNSARPHFSKWPTRTSTTT